MSALVVLAALSLPLINDIRYSPTTGTMPAPPFVTVRTLEVLGVPYAATITVNDIIFNYAYLNTETFTVRGVRAIGSWTAGGQAGEFDAPYSAVNRAYPPTNQLATLYLSTTQVSLFDGTAIGTLYLPPASLDVRFDGTVYAATPLPSVAALVGVIFMSLFAKGWRRTRRK